MITFSKLSKLNPKPEKLAELSILFSGGNWIKAQSLNLSLIEVYEAALKLAIKDKKIEKRLGLWACDCAAHVLHIFEKEKPNDDRPRKAIATSREYLRDTAWAAAWAAARAAARDTAWAAAGDTARDTARAAEVKWQLERLILWLSDNPPEDFN